MEEQVPQTPKETTQPQQSAGQDKNSMMVPVAVVIAGVIIGGAVLFTGKQNAPAPGTNTNPTAQTAPPTGQAADAPVTVKAVSASEHVLGNPNADVFLITYSDLECPFCKRFHPTTKQIIAAYGNKVAVVYRHFPLSFHANAQKEAEASECAAEQAGNDGFWKYIDAIYERTTSNGTGFALDKLAPLAKELGMNDTTFQQCLDSGKYAAKVAQDMSEGVQAGVTGTPGNILLAKDGQTKMLAGAYPFETFKTEIDKLLQ
ncbi:MAG: thioredoxin domain-containing protein [Patescibacteria group bacterium]